MPSKNRFWCKVVKTKTDFLIAICDEEILGKKLNFGEIFVEVKEEFYKERVIDEKEAEELMEKATICNFFGERIVSLAVKKGLIFPENIILIDGVPHAQFVKI